MTKDDNGEGMETKISTDPKTVKMFRRLEKFLDQEGIGSGRSINFQNAETGRVFAIFVSPDTFEAMESVINEQDKELELAQEIIDYLEDGNGLLDIIDAQNDVLQGRVIVDEVEAEFDNVARTFIADAPKKHEDQPRVFAFTADVVAARGL
jgi:hypothetical protein